MNRTIFWVIGIIVAMLVLLCIFKYNSIAELDEGLANAWTPLENVLQPRYDAVPKLVNEVILYTGKEDKETKALADANKDYTSAGGMGAQVKAANKLEAAISDMIIEGGQRYPGISSHYQFMNLKQGFQKTGEQMQQLVKGYNSSVDKYNSYIRKFPNNLIAFLLGFEYRAEYFKRTK
ncbi:MAG: hypothetical protein HN337_07005 [Deltaproteobacteria bacterium]|nr:hypothetical protein [Deltaproteobacteria bacterium]